MGYKTPRELFGGLRYGLTLRPSADGEPPSVPSGSDQLGTARATSCTWLLPKQTSGVCSGGVWGQGELFGCLPTGLGWPAGSQVWLFPVGGSWALALFLGLVGSVSLAS